MASIARVVDLALGALPLGWGAQRFLATVQLQNVRFFERLHWHSLESMDIRGVRHHLMEADLAYYQPASQRRPGLMAA